MQINLLARRLTVGTVLFILTAGCADAPGTDEPISPTASTPSGATTTPQSDAELAANSATQVVRTYYTVRDDLRQDPDAPLDRLKSVATSTELSAQQNLFKREREDGLHQTGDTGIAELRVQGVDLDNSDPDGGRVPTVQVDVCFDVGDVDILDANGKSVVAEDRPDTGWIRYSVANYEWDSDPIGAWRVASSENLERTPCAAS